MARIKVRARTLDMLGRQQMASIPNALHELYKNAYDAYADLARSDYYRREQILTLCDDGIGMTRDDFESRWLTLGTESKMNQGGLEPPYTDKSKPYRYPLGEKGIGRLAIATVGPQVFILSRAERESGLQEMVVSFVNWTFFEVPGLNIDAVEVPLITIPVGKLPSEGELAGLLDLAEKNLTAIKSVIPITFFERISKELSVARMGLPSFLTRIAEMGFGNARGTMFIITPADSILEQDIDENIDDIAPPLLRNLRGFTNTMMPDAAPPPMLAEFWDNKRDGSVDNIIGSAHFFTPEEFLSADQHIEGEFDEYGQFVGTVSIYHQEPQKYLLPWTGAQGQPTRCGRFKIKFGYLQGLKSETLLPEEMWDSLADKLNKFGGLYVYRNGIRVLPYGNSDVDWLNIERRRTKAAKDWIFSYRRLFGAVELSSPENSALVEKAGREGFRENLAYRQFRSMIEHLFKEIARDWFRDNTAKFGNYREKLSVLQEQDQLLKKRAKSLKGRQEKLKKELDGFFNKYESQVPQTIVEQHRIKMRSTLENIHNLSPDEAAKQLLVLEGEMLEALHRLRVEYRVVTPRGITVFKSVRKDLDRSAELFVQLEQECFYPFELEVNQNITRTIAETKALLSHRKRIAQALKNRESSEKKRASATANAATGGSQHLQHEVVSRSRAKLAELELAINEVNAELERTNLAELSEQEVEAFRKTLDSKLEEAAEIQIQDLERLNSQIQATLEAVLTDTPLDETAAALDERAQGLEEELAHYTELAQVGAALGIIQHEFGAAVQGLREGLRFITEKTSHDKELKQACRNISANFEHLDTYLGMVAPLNKRLYRQAQPITGKMILGYILQIFDTRFKRHKIECRHSMSFDGHTVTAYPAAFLPAFINVVDNAVYWLSRDNSGDKLPYESDRIIFFDADQHSFFVSNNGPGIEARDADRIFEMSFTRKQRGRGIGLAVAQKALREAGYDLELTSIGRDNHPIFRITTDKKKTGVRGA